MNVDFYNNNELSGFLWWNGVHSEIAKTILQKFPDTPYKKAELEKLSKSILPVYQNAIRSGYPLYVLPKTAEQYEQSNKTVQYVSTQTSIKSTFIGQYLASLEATAKSGKIDLSEYNPGIEVIKKSKKQIEQESKTGFLEKQINKILIGGFAALGLYIFLKNK